MKKICYVIACDSNTDGNFYSTKKTAQKIIRRYHKKEKEYGVRYDHKIIAIPHNPGWAASCYLQQMGICG